jgi:hypothetical protein
MPKAKKQEAPAIVEDADITFDEPEFDISEESFTEEDIASIAASIVKDAANSGTHSPTPTADDFFDLEEVEKASTDSPVLNAVESFREEAVSVLDGLYRGVETTQTQVDEMAKNFSELSNKVDKLILREDTSKTVTQLVEAVKYLSERIDKLVEASSAPKTPPVNNAPSTVMTMGTTTPVAAPRVDPKIDINLVKTWLRKVPKDKTFPLEVVATKIGSHLGLDPKQVASVIVDSTDIVNVVNGIIHVL